MGECRIKLFQFWNTEHAPDEVEVLMQTWADDPAFEYHRFNAQTADDLIKEKFDSRTLAAYRKCGVPAMQADFFRYCALYCYGGVYVDAGSENLGSVCNLVSEGDRGILLKRLSKDILPNGFMFFSEICDPLLAEVINRSIRNIENRLSNNVWLVTGPGILSTLYFIEKRKDLFSGIKIVSVRDARHFFEFKSKLAYKLEKSDWRMVKRAGGSIYL